MLAQAHLHSWLFLLNIFLMLIVGTPMAIAVASDKKITIVHR